MNDDPKSILETANAAITVGDYEGFLSYCTEDTLWNFVGEQVLKGKEQVREYMLKTYQEPPKFKVKQLIAGTDHVVAMGVISLTNAEGKLIDYNYCDVWKLKDGKLHELDAYVLETKTGNSQHEGQTVIGSGFSYDEAKEHTDESKPASQTSEDQIVDLPDLGIPGRP
ncbi:nuclear transport factor 2 family protein [Pedobacter sp. GR22-6]|uniref:nuclear transport factor 2 family protein n=1 Tax=Pedobacter sp. GR22-6 TaxID=3127957 RepID=UPI00307DDA47